MIFLVAIIHGIFMTAFYLLGRYIEGSIIGGIFLLFLIKITPPIDVLKKPQFLKKEVSPKESLYQSLYFSSGILFYFALVGISISASAYFNISSNLGFFQYCIFFLSSVIYSLYLMLYTKSPGIVAIFRVHCIIMGIFLTILSIVLVIWSQSILGFMLLNIIFILLGLLAVLVLDRKISSTLYIVALYTFLGLIFAGMVAFISTISVLHAHNIAYSLLIGVSVLAGLYIFLPQIMRRGCATIHIPYGIWHVRNTLLWVSWGIFVVLIFMLFRGKIEIRDLTVMSLLILLIFWSWIYVHTDQNPIFFSGTILVLTTLYAYVFFSLLPPLFWLLLICLFAFVGILLLFARYFFNKNEELILAINAVLFICIADFYFIFSGHYTLFLISMLFFLQSFLWYGIYEIFHRHSYAKNEAL